MTGKMQRWFKSLWCEHHWHKVEGTYRKVKIKKAKNACSTDEIDKYMVIAIDIRFEHNYIALKYREECCNCGKFKLSDDRRVLKYSYKDKRARQEMFKSALEAYSDIEDEPINYE